MATRDEGTSRRAGTRDAIERIEAAADRLHIRDLSVLNLEGLDAGAVCLRGTYGGRLRITRDAAMRRTFEENRQCLATWLEGRADNILRGRETAAEAFADCAQYMESWAPAPTPDTLRPCLGLNIERCIDVFRTSLRVLQLPEHQVKVTWDATIGWARFRAQLPSGAVVDKTLRAGASVEANLYGLALWLRGRARGWVSGAESLDLDRVFAGNIAAAVTP